MTLPTYGLTLTGRSTFLLNQFEGGGTQAFGRNAAAHPYKLRLRCNVTGIAAAPLTRKLVVLLQFTVTGTPTNTMSAKLYDAGGTLVTTALESYIAADITAGKQTLFTFNLGTTELNGQFDIILDVDTYVDNKYWNLVVSTSSNPEGQVVLADWHSAAWNDSTKDPYFEMASVVVQDFDISSAIKSANYSRGKNDVDGKYVAGSCDLTLFNDTGAFSTDNVSSPYYGYWDVGSEITLTGTYSGSTYNLFTGFIQRIRPDLACNKRTVFVSCGDRFAAFASQNMSLVSGSGAPYTVIGNILDRLCVPASARDIDTSDTSTLAAKTWTEENGLDVLAAVIEAGQHHHFINEDGEYTFRPNSWLGGSLTADFTWTDTIDIDALKIEQDDKGLYNRFRVNGVAGGWREQTNLASLVRYGQKDLEIDNDLIPNANASDEVIRIIRGIYSERVQGCEITLRGRYPEVFTVKIGSIISLTSVAAGLSAVKFIVYGIKGTADPQRGHDLTITCKKQTSGPYTFNTCTRTSAVGNNSTYAKLQSFKVPIKGRPHYAYFKWFGSMTNVHSVTVCICTDAGGTPGTVIGLGNPYLLTIGVASQEVAQVIGWGTEPNIYYRPLLVPGVLYWFGVTENNPALEAYQIGGTDPGTYADGQAAHMQGGFTIQAGIDYGIGLLIYPE